MRKTIFTGVGRNPFGKRTKGLKEQAKKRRTAEDTFKEQYEYWTNKRLNEAKKNFDSKESRDEPDESELGFGKVLSDTVKNSLLWNLNFHKLPEHILINQKWFNDLLRPKWKVIRVHDESSLAKLQTAFWFKDTIQPFYFDPSKPYRRLKNNEIASGKFPAFYGLHVQAKDGEARFDETVHDYLFLNMNKTGIVEFFKNYQKHLLENEYISNHKLQRLRRDESEALFLEKKKEKQKHRGFSYADIASDETLGYADYREMVFNIAESGGDFNKLDIETLRTIEKYYINYELSSDVKVFLQQVNDSYLEEFLKNTLRDYSFYRYFDVLDEFNEEVFWYAPYIFAQNCIAENGLSEDEIDALLETFNRIIANKLFYEEKPSYFRKDAPKILHDLENAAVQKYTFVSSDEFQDMVAQTPGAIAKADNRITSAHLNEEKRSEENYYKSKRWQKAYNMLFENLDQLIIAEEKLSKLDKLKRDLTYGDLYKKGSTDLFNRCKSIAAFTGSRNIKHDSEEADWIRKKVNELPADTRVITGLAKGADLIATNAALKRGLPVIGVPASGIDKTNYHLMKKILNNDGLMLSQHYGGYKPKKKDYLTKNNVIVDYADKLFTSNSDTRGTKYTIEQAKNKGISIISKDPAESVYRSQTTDKGVPLTKEFVENIKKTEDFIKEEKAKIMEIREQSQKELAKLKNLYYDTSGHLHYADSDEFDEFDLEDSDYGTYTDEW